MPDLLPCPWCGEVPTLFWDDDHSWISCELVGCAIRPETALEDTEAEAIARWNQRAAEGEK